MNLKLQHAFAEKMLVRPLAGDSSGVTILQWNGIPRTFYTFRDCGCIGLASAICISIIHGGILQTDNLMMSWAHAADCEL
jgi:hypothetical protein